MPNEAVNPAAPPSLQCLIRSALVVMGGFLLTKGVSFVQTIIIAAEFGAGAEYDTFVAGSVLPDYIVRLIGGGALAVAFIPVFSALLNDDNRAGAWQLASQVFNTLLLIAIIVNGIVMVTAPFLVETLVAPGLNAADSAQTADLMRILSVATIIFSLSGILSGILHGHNHFFLPVLAPIFQDLGLLFGVIFFLEPFGIYGLAYGILVGAFLHFGIQVPGLIMFKFQWVPRLGWSDPQLRQVVRLMLPRVGIGAAFLINLLVITNVNSRLGTGAISAFGWGLRFIDIPQALIGTAVGIVIFPTLSALSSMGKIEERRQAFSGVIRFIVVATIPATVGLVLVSEDALLILFNEAETARIYTVIQVMSLAVIIQSLHEILTRAFYAEQDTIRPLIFSIVATVIMVITVVGLLEYYLAQREIVDVTLAASGEGFVTTYSISPTFDPPLASYWAVGVPAFGLVFAFLIESILLVFSLKKRWGDLDLPHIVTTATRTLAAAVAMGIAVVLVDTLIRGAGFDANTVSHIGLRIGAKVVTGGVIFGVAALLFGVEEIRQLPALIRGRKTITETE